MIKWIKEQIQKKLKEILDIELKIQKIFETEDFNNIDLEKIKQTNKDINYFEEISLLKKIKEELIIKGCHLTPNMLDNKENKKLEWSEGEKRGEFDYYPPDEGWKGFGLNVLNKYDGGNNDWLGKDGNKNEWAIAYHGIGVKMGSGFTLEKVTNCIINEGFKAGYGQAYAEYDDARHPGKKVGKGVYCSPDPSVMESYARYAETLTKINGKGFIMGFMIRVKPDKIRYSNLRKDYWVLNGNTDEMRPYRILVKEKNYRKNLLEVKKLQYKKLEEKYKKLEDDNYRQKMMNLPDNDNKKILLKIQRTINKTVIVGNKDWSAYVRNKLICKQDIFGHVYLNVLSEAAIIGINGVEWAKTSGLDITKEEINELNKIFQFDSNSYTILFVKLAGKSFRVIHYVKGEHVYLKINEGGDTVSKTKMAFIIGIYNNTQIYTVDGIPKTQCIGMCNTVVEDLAKELRSYNY